MLFRTSNKNQQVPVHVGGLKRKGNATHKCFIRSDVAGLDRTEAAIRNDRNVKDLRVKEHIGVHPGGIGCYGAGDQCDKKGCRYFMEGNTLGRK